MANIFCPVQGRTNEVPLHFPSRPLEKNGTFVVHIHNFPFSYNYRTATCQDNGIPSKKIYLHYIRYHANRPENRRENIVISLSMLLINGIAHWFGHLYESIKWKRWRAFSPHICRQRHWLIIYNFWSCKCGKQSVEKLANGYHYFTNSYQRTSISLGTSGSLTDILRGSKWDFRFFMRIKLSC